MITTPASSTSGAASTPTPAPKKPKATKKAKAPKGEGPIAIALGAIGGAKDAFASTARRAVTAASTAMRRRAEAIATTPKNEIAARIALASLKGVQGAALHAVAHELRGMLPPEAHELGESRGDGVRRRAAPPPRRRRIQARGDRPGVRRVGRVRSRAGLARLPGRGDGRRVSRGSRRRRFNAAGASLRAIARQVPRRPFGAPPSGAREDAARGVRRSRRADRFRVRGQEAVDQA